MVTRNRKLNEEEKLERLRELLRRSAGYDADKFASDRKMALDYYFQRPRGDEVKGRSQVVSGDFSAMVEAVLSQTMDAFDSDALAEFQALDQFDEDQAQLEMDTVQRLVMQGANNGFLEFSVAIKDALMMRNGVFKVWTESHKQTFTREFTGVTPEALGVFLSNLGATEANIEDFNPETGDLKIKLTTDQQKLKAEALDVTNFLYLEDWDKLDLQGIPFCAERHVEPRSNLIARGFPKAKVNALEPFHVERKIDGLGRQVQSTIQQTQGIDQSQENVEWYECYVLMDSDGDGISERHRISIGGESQNVVLEDVEVRIVPYAAGAVLLNPHTFTGVSLFDKLKMNQDIGTGLQRGFFDNINAVNRARLAYLDGKVNVDDLDSGRHNGDVRVKASVGDVNRAIAPVQVPDMTQGILSALEYNRGLRSEMGGASLDLATGQMQLNDRVGSEGLDRAYSVMEQLAAFMTKTIAKSLIRSVFLLAHATLRLEFTQPIRLKRHGRWQNVNPREWVERTNLDVRVGMSPNERARRSQVLRTVLTDQISLSEQGMDGVLVNVNNFYAAEMDWLRASDIPNPEKYFIDPLDPNSQKAFAQKQDAEARQQDMQRAFMAQAVELEQIRAALEKYKQDTDLQFKYWEAVLDSEIEEAKIVGNATADLVARQNQQNDEIENGRSEQADSTPDSE